LRNAALSWYRERRMQDANDGDGGGEGDTSLLARRLTLAAIVIAVGATAFFAFQPRDERSFWLLATGPTALLALVALAHPARAALLERLRPKAGDATVGIFSAATLFVCAYGFTRTVMPASSPRVAWLALLYAQLGDPDDLRGHALRLFVALVLVAAAEEIVWRGVVSDLLAPEVGARLAWVASAALYAVANLPTMWSLRSPNAGLDPLLPIAALGAGLVWGAMAKRFGRLVPSIISHAMFDWAVVVMFRLWGGSL
jgi:membrane protease YdiL (CAAX protease family)